MKKFKALGQMGFTFAEVMIATAMMTMTSVAMLGVSQIANQDSLQLRSVRVALTARMRIEASLKNPAAWRQTVAQNASFACVAVTPGCDLASTNSGYYDFVLYGVTAGEKVTFDATDSQTRLTLQGTACAAGTPNPDPQCPIKFIARWKPLCQTYPCLNPTLDIKILLTPEFGTSAPPINPQKYEYSTVRGIEDGSLESACRILNGNYNAATGTCYPKYGGRSCAALGRPAEIVTAVAADGTITCAPLYTGQCNPATQVMDGINAQGVAQCRARTQPANCPTACVGGWGSCSATCGGGVETYTITSPATNGGPACPFVDGATAPCNTQACPPVPIDCVGNFGACSASCGGGTMTYSISTPAANGGASCTFANGATQTCNTQACAGPVDCVGAWDTCSATCGGGTQSYSITTAAANGGIACPYAGGDSRACNTQSCAAPVDCAGGFTPCSAACGGGIETYSISTPAANGGAACPFAGGATQACNTQACPPSPVDCVGGWGSCSQPCGGGTMTYAISTPAANGGLSCSNNAGDTMVCNSQACAVPVDCGGSWSSCNPVSGTRTFTVTQAPQNGGAACPSPLTDTCPVDCVGSFGACGGAPPPFRTYTWTTPPLNGGSAATCAYPDGTQDAVSCQVPGHFVCNSSGGGAPEPSCSNRPEICTADDAGVAAIEGSACNVGDTASFNRTCDFCGSSGISGGLVTCDCQP